MTQPGVAPFEHRGHTAVVDEELCWEDEADAWRTQTDREPGREDTQREGRGMEQ